MDNREAMETCGFCSVCYHYYYYYSFFLCVLRCPTDFLETVSLINLKVCVILALDRYLCPPGFVFQLMPQGFGPYNTKIGNNSLTVQITNRKPYIFVFHMTWGYLQFYKFYSRGLPNPLNMTNSVITLKRFRSPTLNHIPYDMRVQKKILVVSPGVAPTRTI